MEASLRAKIEALQNKQVLYEQQLKELQQRSDIHYALNEILQLSLLPLSLREILDKILVLLLDIPWLALNRKGSVFLLGESGKDLDLIVEYNLGPILQKQCKQVPFGTCLCGLAAQTGEMVFRNCIDADHHHRPAGISPHGHYCVPIKNRNGLMGVLNLYVEAGHTSTPLEVEFLQASTAAMAGIIERKKLEEQLITHSFQDELTGLPNRRQLYANLKRAVARAERSGKTLAIFFMDMDGFKGVNDTFGHDIGDLLLQESAQRLNDCLRPGDTLARLGGDEFLALLEPTGLPGNIEKIADRLRSFMSDEFVIRGNHIRVGISIGISYFPNHGSNADELLKRADEQMYIDKRNKRKELV